MNYKEDLTINLNKLEEEWAMQPILFGKYSREWKDAVQEEDKAKAKLKLVYATLDLDVRKNYKEKYGLEKVTDKIVDATVITQEEHIKATRFYIECKHEASILEIANKEFDQRKYALQNEVDLWTKGYFSTPVDNTNMKKEDVKVTKQEMVNDRKRSRRTRKTTEGEK